MNEDSAVALAVKAILEAFPLFAEIDRANFRRRGYRENSRLPVIVVHLRTSEVMAPKTSTTHDVMRDASEFVLSLVSDTPFDSDLTATGDAISATISEAHVEGAKGAELAWLLGATVRGRITRVEHRKTTFLFAVAFETLDVKGVVSPFYAKLIHNPPFCAASRA